MNKKVDKKSVKMKDTQFKPTMANLDSVQKSFEKARKKILNQKNISKKDFVSV